ncbi:hypothetical protein E2C01_071190 [Portunus trituberculatus]|uniref:Uncharacterized protein n=1 Tax=Portunus trituberculatus TaxID=210409 RepID=A0A5B7HUR0_PORTR|nr:hypothetical protein [Portunus trituberculatus]
MAKYQSDSWWDSNLREDVCPIPRSPPHPLRHRLPYLLSYIYLLPHKDLSHAEKFVKGIGVR